MFLCIIHFLDTLYIYFIFKKTEWMMLMTIGQLFNVWKVSLVPQIQEFNIGTISNNRGEQQQ